MMSSALAPTDVAAYRGRSDAVGAWARVSGRAASAMHEWTSALPASWHGDARWAAVADAAAVAAAVATLDWHLLKAAPTGSRTRLVLHDATMSSLMTATMGASLLAAGGPLTSWEIAAPLAQQRRLVVVRDPADLPRAQAALLGWLNQASLGPRI